MDEQLRRARAGLGALGRSASRQFRRFRFRQSHRRHNLISSSTIAEPMLGIDYFTTGLPNAEITTTITSDGPAGNPDFYTSTSRDILAVTSLTQTETRISIPPGTMRRPSVTMRANRADRRRARTSSILGGVPLADNFVTTPTASEDGNNPLGVSGSGNDGDEIQESPTSPPPSDSDESEASVDSKTGLNATPRAHTALATAGENATVIKESSTDPAITASVNKSTGTGVGASGTAESTQGNADDGAATEPDSVQPVAEVACNADATFGPSSDEATGEASGSTAAPASITAEPITELLDGATPPLGTIVEYLDGIVPIYSSAGNASNFGPGPIETAIVQGVRSPTHSNLATFTASIEGHNSISYVLDMDEARNDPPCPDHPVVVQMTRTAPDNIHLVFSGPRSEEETAQLLAIPAPVEPSIEDVQAASLAMVAAVLGRSLPPVPQQAGNAQLPPIAGPAGAAFAMNAAQNEHAGLVDGAFPPPPYTPVHANQLFPNAGQVWQIPGDEHYPHCGAHLSLATNWFSNQSIPIVCGTQIFHLPSNIVRQFSCFRQLFDLPPGPGGYVLTGMDPQVFTVLAHCMMSTTGFEGTEEGLNLVLLVLALETALRMQIPSEAKKINDSISRYIVRRVFYQNPFQPDFDGVLDHSYHVFRSEEIYRAWKILFDSDARLNMQDWLLDTDIARLYTVVIPENLWPALTTNFQAYFNTIIDGMVRFRDAPEDEEFSLFWWQVVRGTDFLRNNWIGSYPHMRDFMAHQIQLSHNAENIPNAGQAAGNAGGASRNVSNGTLETLIIDLPQEPVLHPVIDIMVNEPTADDTDQVADIVEDVMPDIPRPDSPIINIFEDETADPIVDTESSTNVVEDAPAASDATPEQPTGAGKDAITTPEVTTTPPAHVGLRLLGEPERPPAKPSRFWGELPEGEHVSPATAIALGCAPGPQPPASQPDTNNYIIDDGLPDHADGMSIYGMDPSFLPDETRNYF